MTSPLPYQYEYPRPAVTVDAVVFALDGPDLVVLLIRRDREPFAGRWAIPGGFLEMDEEVEAGVRRDLKEETGLESPEPFVPIGFFGAVGRDPRGRTISLAFMSTIGQPLPDPVGSDDARDAAWVRVREARDLAFDHDLILSVALDRIAREFPTGTFGLGLLPDPFRKSDILRLVEALGRRPIEAEWWTRRLIADGKIVRTYPRSPWFRRQGPQFAATPER